MEFYLDTANIKLVKKLYRILPLSGVTTNPSIIAKENLNLVDVLQSLQDIFENKGNLFAQVLGHTENEIVEEAMKLREKFPSIIVKIPVIPEGIAAIKTLSKNNIPTLGTAVYGAAQGLLSALSGSIYIAPYVNRIDSQNGNGIQTVSELQTLLNLHSPKSKILAASFRTPRQVLDCMLTGCAAVTVPPEIAELFLKDPAVFSAIDQFDQDWFTTFHKKQLF
ncbi:MAG: fructose-6-phosphate aldolase [Pasteurellaceae bacterium]|nr:fructose-6-phosphate aldolase [Pasteurellaceae bacterium]